jgi:hypothetical protein
MPITRVQVLSEISIETVFNKEEKMKSSITIESRFNELIEEYGRFLRHMIIRVCPKGYGLAVPHVLMTDPARAPGSRGRAAATDR